MPSNKPIAMKYKYLEHTSEAKFKAFGKDINELFKNSALAMMNILGDTRKVEAKITKRIEIKSRDRLSLLYDFLNELIFLLDTAGLFVCDVKKIKITKSFELEADIVGDSCKNYELHGDLKSVTYNDMSIKKTKRGYEAVVVVDV